MKKNIILGAGGHAKEVIDILNSINPKISIAFFDNTPNAVKKLFNFDVYNTNEKLKLFQNFYLGTGQIHTRRLLSDLALKYNLKWEGVRSDNFIIGDFDVNIENTVDIMQNVNISSSVNIGRGTLLNRSVSIHHDVSIGEFCEIAPFVKILGKVELDDDVFVGAGAIILPNIKINKGAIIGAGSIVTKDVDKYQTVVGSPARIYKK